VEQHKKYGKKIIGLLVLQATKLLVAWALPQATEGAYSAPPGP